MLRVSEPALASTLVSPGAGRGCGTHHVCPRSAGSIPASAAPWPKPCRQRTRLQKAGRVAARFDSCSAPALPANPVCTADSASLPATGARLARLSDACRICCIALVASSVLWTVLTPAAQAATAAATSGGGFSLSGAAKGLVSFALHLDKHLGALIAQHGTSTYAILFAIVFAETGLVLTPFLPGDSLLFAAGAFAALGSLHLPSLMGIFITAAILGDAVNYTAGHYLGGKALRSGLVKKEYFVKTEDFYAKHGAKTVVLARFIPIVRTFAPFVAGVGSMDYAQFAWFNVAGAVLWTVLFVGAGFFFGNLPFVQHNFTLVVLAIVLVSVLPIVAEVVSARREAASQGRGAGVGNSDVHSDVS